MEEFFGALLAIALALIAAFFAFTCLLAGSPALVAGLVAAWHVRRRRIERAIEDEAAQVGGAVSLEISDESGRLSWTFDRARLAGVASRNAGAFQAATTGVIAGLGALEVVWALIPTYRAIEVVHDALPFVVLLPSGVIVWLSVLFCAPDRLSRGFESAIEARLAAVVAGAGPRLAELAALAATLDAESEWTGRRLSVVDPDPQGGILQTLQAEAFRDPTSLEAFAAAACDRCRADLSALQSATAAFRAAVLVAEEAERAVRATGSNTLLFRLDGPYNGLVSDGLLDLVPQRRWSEFHTIVAAVTEELRSLQADACRFNDAGTAGSSGDRVPTTLEEAYAVLGVPPAANDEQIRQVWLAQVKIWHPEGRVVTDDHRVKALNAAYEIIKRRRRQP